VFDSGYGEIPTVCPELKRFQFRRLLGISATGRLYRIRKSGEFGAVKILERALCAGNPRFKQWIDFMQRVQDLPRSATLKPTQLSREGDSHFLARAYLEGPDATLRELLTTEKPLGSRFVADLAVALLNSLCAFHSLKIVHGNLKPENVLLSEGAVRLSDPGVHLLLAGLSPGDRLLRLWNTERYQAPEVQQGGEPTTESDIYAAGHVLEDVLELHDRGQSPQESGDAFLLRLRESVKRMSAFDPSDRYATAKEALRDLQRKDRPVKAPPQPPSSGPASRKTPGTLLRTLWSSQLTGPLILVAVLVVLFLQGFAWMRARTALASSSREAQIAAELISRNVDALVLWTRTSGAQVAEAEERWEELSRLFQGTSWEPHILRRSRQALAHVPRPGQRRIREELMKVRSEAGDGRWVEALEGLLALQHAPESEELEEVARQVRRGLYEDLGMVFIPAGEVGIVRHGEKTRLEVPPFLADAGLLPREEHKEPPAPGEEGAREAGSAEARVGISFEEAESLAAAAGKRLPSEAEWDRLAAMRTSKGEWEEFAASRIQDIPGSVFQWVAEQVPDSLTGEGYGVCRGGGRPGIPGTHPLRRRKKLGYPDVGVRFVQDVEPRSLTDS
jgi:serine/threonine protein kinase